MRFEDKMISLQRMPNAIIHAPPVAVPLTEDLTGSLRTLQTDSSVVTDQIHAKQYAIDPALKLKKAMADPMKNKHAKRRSDRKKTTKTLPRYYTKGEGEGRRARK